MRTCFCWTSGRTLLTAAFVSLATVPPESATAVDLPSHEPGMPPAVLSYREEVLPVDEYAARAPLWRAYLADHPESGFARIQLAQALRYSRRSAEELEAPVREAHLTDPTCAEAADAMARQTLQAVYFGDKTVLTEAVALPETRSPPGVRPSTRWPPSLSRARSTPTSPDPVRSVLPPGPRHQCWATASDEVTS